MKKKILVLIVLVSILVVGCGNNSKKNIHKITLYDNSSTGYKWKYSLDKKDIVKITSDTDYSECNGRVGCSGKLIYSLEPLKAGNVTMTLQYVGPTDKIDEEITYNIKVDKDLKITLSHSIDKNNYILEG